jgi:TonB family protein
MIIEISSPFGAVKRHFDFCRNTQFPQVGTGEARGILGVSKTTRGGSIMKEWLIIGLAVAGLAQPLEAQERQGRIVPTRAKGNLAALVSDSDYPAAALQAREEGMVEFRLDVGANGRATDCIVIRSSGSAALDSTTCRIMRSRARFTPALDAQGRPVGDSTMARIGWKLPPPPSPAG